MPNIDGQRIRQTMLEVIRVLSLNPRQPMQSWDILEGAREKLDISAQDNETQQAILTVFHDMFRNGILAWGYNFSNPNPPFCHQTEQGRRTLRNLSRDPANPDGYLAQSYLANISGDIKSYVEEALKTYNSDCYRAATVMIGVASEALTLELRDAIVTNWAAKLNTQNRKRLNDWRIKTVLDEIQRILDTEKVNMSVELKERYEAHWASFVHKIRMSRNDAGHPASIKALTNETAESNLIAFPELTKLVDDIKVWISSSP